MMEYANTAAEARWSDEGRITEVHTGGDYVSVTTDQSIGFGVETKHRTDLLRVGGRVEIAGGLGFPIQGVRVDGQIVFFKTPPEMQADREEMLAGFQRKRIEEFERHGVEWRAAMDALPTPLRARMERFTAEHGGFEALFRDDGSGSYELFCCTEAVKFADYFRPRLAGKTTEEAEGEVRAFRALPHEQQRMLVPFDDGHSGNTFGGAVVLGARVALGLDV